MGLPAPKCPILPILAQIGMFSWGTLSLNVTIFKLILFQNTYFGMFLIGKHVFQYFRIKSTFPLIILVAEWPINSLIHFRGNLPLKPL